jgi:hypothetical protein
MSNSDESVEYVGANPNAVLSNPKFVEIRKVILNEVSTHITSELVLDVDKILGETLTIIDTLDLPEKQDKAIKDLIKARFKSRMLTFTNTLNHSFNNIWNKRSGIPEYFIDQSRYTLGKQDAGRML